MTPGGEAAGAGWVVEDVVVDSAALREPWRVLVQRPAQRDPTLPWLWLLHGSMSSAEQLRPVLAAAARAMDDGTAPQLIIAAPDAPTGYRSSWWVDSAYAPVGAPPTVGEFTARAGRPLERGLLEEVLPAVEARYGGPAGPGRRAIGGISMGGAAALRWLIVRPELFGSALLLSAAAYSALPPLDSSARLTGAFGVGAEVFSPERFGELMHYPGLLAARPPGVPPSTVVIIVGDEEPAQSDGVRRCDLDLEAARLHAALKARADVRSVLRVVPGGHDWPVWEREIGGGLGLLLG